MTSGPGVASSDADIMIRYVAPARAAAGCDNERLTGRCVGDVLEAAAVVHAGLGIVHDFAGRAPSDSVPAVVAGPQSRGAATFCRSLMGECPT